MAAPIVLRGDEKQNIDDGDPPDTACTGGWGDPVEAHQRFVGKKFQDSAVHCGSGRFPLARAGFGRYSGGNQWKSDSLRSGPDCADGVLFWARGHYQSYIERDELSELSCLCRSATLG